MRQRADAAAGCRHIRVDFSPEVTLQCRYNIGFFWPYFGVFMDFQTGPATKAEIAAIAELEHAAFGEHCYPSFLFRQAFDLWPELLWCVRDNQQVLAYLLAAPMLHRPKVLNIMSVAVAPSQQGKGVGQLLVQSFCQSQQQNVDIFWLTVDPQNQSAQRLYQRLGFTIARYEEDYYHPGEPRLVMELDLTNKT